MSLYERWHKFADKQAEKEKKFFNKYLNLHTYGGAFRSLLMYLVAWYLLRHIYDMSTWIENFFNLEYDQPTEADKSWHRLWARC